MENWNAYMDVLFNLQEIRQIGDSFWLYATVLLLVTAAVILVAACIRKRRENDDEASCEDGETDNSDRNAGDRNVNEMGNLAVIIDALGGMDNIYNLACSDTRLRVTVNDGTLVNRMRLKSSGALGVLAKGRQVQVFYENQVENICRELKRCIESNKYMESEKEDADYERVLKKVYVPVEGDIVCVSDIHCLQDVGDGSIGVWYVVGIHLIADGQRDWNNVCQPVNIRLMCNEGERVRKGKLLAEYPYETFAGMGDKVYVVLEAYVSESSTSEGERSDEDMDRRYHLVINNGKRVDYEHVACEIVE